MEITDLDAIVGPSKHVKLGGVEYTLPSDMPMEIFLRINQAGRIKNEDGEEDQIAQMQALVSAICDLFTFEQPEGSDPAPIHQAVEGVLKKRGVRFSFELMKNIYSDDEVTEEAPEGADPTPQAQVPEEGDSNGTKSSTT